MGWKTGLIGWRGMVGSVLLSRMKAEGDFSFVEPTFFSTSSPGDLGPDVGDGAAPLEDAYDLEALARQEVLISCQGGDYTQKVYGPLRASGWTGFWIDAASALRMSDEAVLVLDPVNGRALRAALADERRTFVGTNCTVGLLMMGLAGLFREELVEWVSTMSYQAVSGAGARAMRELVAQMRRIGSDAGPLLDDPATSILELDRKVSTSLAASSFPTDHIGVPLAGSALPWIDRRMEDGQTREEWKAMVEANKLLGTEASPVPIDGVCVRIGAMRCHAQAVTLKLRRDVPLHDLEAILDEAHPWAEIVENTKEATLSRLTPAAVAGTLQVPVGRVRKMKMGPEFVSVFTVGDQLLWGAAEPLRRLLRMIVEA